MNAPWLSLKRLVGLPAATSAHEGQLRYDRDGAVDGKLYVGRALADGTTEWFDLIDGATPVPGRFAQTSSDNTTTTSTTDFITAMDFDFTLPAGTWRIDGIGCALFKHSASGTVDVRLEIGATAGTETSAQDRSSSAFAPVLDTLTALGVSGGGTVPITLGFRAGTAGTVTCDEPWVFLIATRTG